MKRKLALSIAAFAVALVVAEIVVRAVWGPDLRTIYRLDDEVLHELIPGSSHVFVRDPANGADRVRVEVNADGYRGPPLRAAPAHRVVVFGDSFVHAEYSRYADTFCARLETRLAEGLARDVEVVNAGVSGYGPAQSLLRLEREFATLRPDLVILAICADNDFGDLVRNKLFRLDGDALVRNRPRIGEVVQREFAAPASPSYLWRLVRKVRRIHRHRTVWNEVTADERTQVEVAHALVEGSLAEGRAAYEDFVVRGDDVVRNLLADHYDADVALEPESPAAVHKVALMRAVLARVAERLAGTRALVVAIPSAVDACDAHGNGIVDRAKWPAYDRARLSRTVAECARAAGLDCVDLFDEFRARGQELFFVAPDGHWNEIGQDFAAKLVADHLLAQ